MIRIIIYKNYQDEYTGFRSEGHAGFADRGQDILCAAVSALVINTVNSIDRLTSDRIDLDINEKKGLIAVRFEKKPSPQSVLLMDALILGLSEIKNDYGDDYITLNFKEV